jgi:hypothetical protein
MMPGFVLKKPGVLPADEAWRSSRATSLRGDVAVTSRATIVFIDALMVGGDGVDAVSLAAAGSGMSVVMATSVAARISLPHHDLILSVTTSSPLVLYATHFPSLTPRREKYHKNLSAQPVIYVGMNAAHNSTCVMNFAELHTSHPRLQLVTAIWQVITTHAQIETEFVRSIPVELVHPACDGSHHSSPPSHQTRTG